MPDSSNWPALCLHLAALIRDKYPWYFDGEDGHLGLVRIKHLQYVKWMGEECCICDQNIGGQEALMAIFHTRVGFPPLEGSGLDEVFFLAHPACCGVS